MLLERAEMIVAEGKEAAFADAMRAEGLPLLATVPGVVRVEMGRGVEAPSKFMLLVEWETMDAHIAFTKMPVFATFRAVFGGLTVGGSMEHFEMG